MSFKPYTEKMEKKKIGICSILGPGSIIPEADPRIRIRMIRIRNTAFIDVTKNLSKIERLLTAWTPLLRKEFFLLDMRPYLFLYYLDAKKDSLLKKKAFLREGIKKSYRHVCNPLKPLPCPY